MGSVNDFRIAIFGPQATHWTTTSLSALSSALLDQDDLHLIRKAFMDLPSVWPLLEAEFGQAVLHADVSGLDELQALSEFAAGTRKLDPKDLTNTKLAPLTVLSQFLDFIRAEKQDDDIYSGLQATQGFCIGFLGAAVLSSSKNSTEFKASMCNAVRLAACIGIVIDFHEATKEQLDRAMTVTVRCKTAADRAYLATCLDDSSPKAYMSCITDDNTYTITLPQKSEQPFRERLGDEKIVVSALGINGSYHHSTHSETARSLARLCARNHNILGLGDADKLRLPLRSTANAQLITSGALHEIAIDLILCKRLHWFQTIKQTLPIYQRVSFLVLGTTGGTGKNSVAPKPRKNPPTSRGHEIAVVGMSCRFPRAENLAAFWELLTKGETAFGPLPPDRFHPSQVSREPKLAKFSGNFLARADLFDHAFFSLSGREAKSMDPQQRLALEVAYEALEAAGYFSIQPDGRNTDVGCYLGVGAVDYEHNVTSEDATVFSAVGTLRAFISGRISHFFGWKGPSITLDTACSSSAVAIHTACRAVLGGECSMALAGGVNVITSPSLHQNLAAASFLNPQGSSSRAFDTAAAGYCRGEGAGMIVLKRLSNAVDDGDQILGVIASSAVNQGSNCSSITVPDSISQSDLYQRVMSRAGIKPSQVSYVEAHGTGTPVGDPIEYESVRLALTGAPGTGRDGPFIGHTEAASGVAGVIKVLLMMQHNTIPKQAACADIVIPKETQLWRSGDTARAALVNNYGAAGSNSAMLLRSYHHHGQPSSVAADSTTYPSHLQAYARTSSGLSFASIAYNLSRTRNITFENRLAAMSALDKLLLTTETMSTHAKKLGSTDASLATGRSVKISRQLQHLDGCDAVCETLGLGSIYPAIFLGDETDDVVDTLVGHSFGQLAALCVAGSISDEDCFRLVAGRAKLIRESWGPESGAMLSLECDQTEMEAVVDAVNLHDQGQRHVGVACYNGSRSFVLAGDAASIACARQECQQRTIKTTSLNNTHAYHCYLADSIMPDLADLTKSITIRPPMLRVETCSADNRSWTQFTATEVAQHTRTPVYFGDAIERIAARSPAAVWLEAGSDTPVVAMARRAVANQSDGTNVFIPIGLGSDDGQAMSNLARATCHLWRAGSASKFWLFQNSTSRYPTISLPPYPFERTSHWIQLKMGALPTSNNKTDKGALVSLVKKESAGGYLFSVDKANHFFVLAGRGHAVTGHSLCPASMYIELAVLASRSVIDNIHTNEYSLLPHVEGLEMSAPLGLGTSTSLFLRLHQHDDSSHSWSFSLFSRLSEADGKTTEHARGKMSLDQADTTTTTNGGDERRLKLLQRFATQGIRRLTSAAHAGTTTGVSGAMVYHIFSEVVDYANYYQWLGSVAVPATLQQQAKTASCCDPIILDNFLQVAGIHVNCLSESLRRDKSHVFVCTAVEEVMFTSSFMASKGSDVREWSVYTRCDGSVTAAEDEVANDMFVCDAASGNLVMAVLGATFRSVPFKSLAKGLSRLNKIVLPASVSNTATKDTARTPDSSSSDVDEDSGYQSRASSVQAEAVLPNDKPKIGADNTSKSQETEADKVQLVRNLFSGILEVAVDEIAPTSTLDDMGVDSLLIMEVVSEIHSQFHVDGISQSDLLGCRVIQAVSRLIWPHNSNHAADEVVGEVEVVDAADTLRPQQDRHDGTDLAKMSKECFATVKTSYISHANATGFSGFYGAAFTLQSDLVVRYVVDAFSTLGCDLQSMQAGQRVPIIPYEPKHSKLIPQLYKLLQDAGLLVKEDGETFHRTQTLIPSSSAETLHQRMLAEFPIHASESQLLHATGPRLADCLGGKADPIALIFQNAAARALLEDVYTNAPMFKTGTLLLGEYLSSVLERIGGRRELRILELGAGTGGTSKHIIETLSALGQRKFSYTFTDLSPSLVAAAKHRFAKWSSLMRYRTMDIEQEPAAQDEGQYDIILSTNCIHATRDLVVSATNIRKMLRPDGILCVWSSSRATCTGSTWCLGCSRAGGCLAMGREHALAHEETWDRCLREAGFQWVDWSATDATLAESEILRVITAAASPQLQTVVFKELDGVQLEADIYFPTEATIKANGGDNKLPVALMIHGGGHIMLSRHDIRPEQTDMLLNSGFVAISIDYRLCPETTLLEGAMVDVFDALAWIRTVLPHTSVLRADINEVGIDGQHVVAVGWSSGGHLAMTLAWTSIANGISPPPPLPPPSAILAFYCATDFEDPFWSSPNVPAGAGDHIDKLDSDNEFWTTGLMDTLIVGYNVPTEKRALGGWLATGDPRSRLALHMNTHGRTLDILLGGLDRNTRRALKSYGSEDVRAASPLAQIKERRYGVPTFLIHPRLDDLIPWEQSERTYHALRERGVEAELRIVDEGAKHLFDLSPRREKVYEVGMRAVAEGYAFLARHVGQSAQSDDPLSCDDPWISIANQTEIDFYKNCPDLSDAAIGFFVGHEFKGPFELPGVKSIPKLSSGYLLPKLSVSDRVDDGVTSISMPDLTNITLGGIWIGYVDNVTSLSFP
ncbi:hypothetical protein B0H66DRAFT_633155 [Apodospora peruviana]|uniref:Polyketide synthase n=1 Tax=Apodospora peruviana TaxID=516989 RepID=A0AAE0HT49_9PEZI|nr:hypothetical protein B0H66DRAFT_633155 [Apodospora peruviana]